MPKVNHHVTQYSSYFEFVTHSGDFLFNDAEARELAYKVLACFGEYPPVPSTPPDPALLLAKRIASISAETGLKPRMIWAIIDNLRWADERAAERAQEAAAPQENLTDD